MLQNPVFHIKLNPLSTIFNFSQFHEHIFRNSRLQRHTRKVGPRTLRWDRGPKTLRWDPRVKTRWTFYPNCFISNLLGCFFVGFNKLRIKGVALALHRLRNPGIPLWLTHCCNYVKCSTCSSIETKYLHIHRFLLSHIRCQC